MVMKAMIMDDDYGEGEAEKDNQREKSSFQLSFSFVNK